MLFLIPSRRFWGQHWTFCFNLDLYKTRSSAGCLSHHQNVIRKGRIISKIVTHCQKPFNMKLFCCLNKVNILVVFCSSFSEPTWKCGVLFYRGILYLFFLRQMFPFVIAYVFPLADRAQFFGFFSFLNWLISYNKGSEKSKETIPSLK